MPTEKSDKGFLREAAAAYGEVPDSIQSLGNGLIQETYLVRFNAASPVVLQQLNTSIFKDVDAIQHNYLLIQAHLRKKKFFIPAPAPSLTGALLYKTKNGETWRAFEYVQNSFSPADSKTVAEVKTVARCFGSFAAAFNDFNASTLKTIIPQFHDLAFRFHQFETALNNQDAEINREVSIAIADVLQRKFLVDVFNGFADERSFPLRVMHHDCKISNLLFDRASGDVICPVDMDTVMPGKFFSDIGDMVRTACCTQNEESTDWVTIALNTEFYEVLCDRYTQATDKLFTNREKEAIHYAGLVMIYMQAIRFLTDHLNGNVYYKTTYKMQNLCRAKNQLLLLRSLEGYLRTKRHVWLPLSK